MGCAQYTALGENEQLVVTNCSGHKSTRNGPGCFCLLCISETERREHQVLSRGQYCVVQDNLSGQLRVEYGPTVIAMNAMDAIKTRVTDLPVLKPGDFVKIKNLENGELRIVVGPALVQLGVNDEVQDVQRYPGGVRKLPVLKKGEYCRIQNDQEGTVKVTHGPCIVELGARDEPICGQGSNQEGVRVCPNLAGDEYLTVRSTSDGKCRNVHGPMLFAPGPFDEFGRAKKVINLARNEYVRIRDAAGGVRVERGEQRVIPDPLDVVEAGTERAVNIDTHHAVLLRNTDTGTLELVTEPGLFFPTQYQQIVEVQEKILLEPYETVVIRDPTGRFYYAKGDPSLPDHERGPGPNFFLPPHHELVTQMWSTDVHKEMHDQGVSRFDSRPSYMKYEFCLRTLDNVELELVCTFYWRIIDVRLMVTSCADAPGDTCTHARSMIMQQVSKVKLMDFLERFNELIRAACMEDPFYAERGIELLSAEVLKFECTSEDTSQILREIIQETCDRLRRNERQRGENEVSLTRIEGEIAEEQRRQELIEVRKSHLLVEARIEGEAEGMRIASFLSKLATYDGPDGEGKGESVGAERSMEIWKMLRTLDLQEKQSEHKRASVEALGGGSAQLYVLPDDVNLHFGTFQNPMPKPGEKQGGALSVPCPAVPPERQVRPVGAAAPAAAPR